jgi:probable F420-dependent oxidoreductase
MGRCALSFPFRGVPLAQHAPLLRRVEALGYDDVWAEEADTVDAVTPLALAATCTERVRLVTGVVNPFTRGPAVLAQTAAALADLSGDRFVLGLGSSSNVIVENWNGMPFERPLSRMRTTVALLRRILDGQRSEGGFGLSAPPAKRVSIIVAALRPKMLALAAELADGACTNLLPLSSVDRVVEAFGTPGKELAGAFYSVVGPEDEALRVAKRHFTAYATVPVYSAYLRWLGWADEITPMVEAWRMGDRRRALELVPETLVRDIFLIGPLEAQRERLEEFRRRGVTTTVLAFSCPPDRLSRTIEAFAPSAVPPA